MATKGVNISKEADLYLQGLSIPQISDKTGISRSTLRFRFKKMGILRDRADAVRIAANDGRLGSGNRGKKLEFSQETIEKIRASAIARGEKSAVGSSLKPSGYLEITRGKNKGRSVHVLVMEERLGRKLKCDEVVHHIDGNKLNNQENNLALCTRAGHARLHRFEEGLSGEVKNRNSNGTWSKTA